MTARFDAADSSTATRRVREVEQVLPCAWWCSSEDEEAEATPPKQRRPTDSFANGGGGGLRLRLLVPDFDAAWQRGGHALDDDGSSARFERSIAELCVSEG